MSRTIHGNPSLSRPVGSKMPYRLLTRERVVAKPVSIASDPRATDPNWHYAPAAGIWIRTADLYDNRKKR
jgi:hypothetical protein